MHHTTHETSAHHDCITMCSDCHAICVSTISHCLAQGGRHVEASHIRTLADCAQICATSADFMLRESSHHAKICEACAEVCEACAKSCEQMPDDAMMRACADACRRCAESCRAMATA